MHEKISFELGTPSHKKHSTRFDFIQGSLFDALDKPGAVALDEARFKPSFYIPTPFAAKARRIKVTIEIID